jgi:predicted histone-like DNA-binding protein
MPITYKVAKCRNPRNPDVDYYKGTAVKTGDYSFDDLAEDIALATTCTKGDILAVLASIKPFITKALLNGNRVVLNDLGAFHISIQGKCYPKEVMQAEDFSPSAQIKGHRILFRPEVGLKKAIAKGFKLQRISSDAMA